MLPYERQLEFKQRQVDEALRRLGKLDGFELRRRSSPRSSSGATATSSSTPSGTAATAHSCAASTAPGSWEHIEPLDDCLLASERGNAARVAALDWCRAQGLSAYDRRSQLGLLRNLVVREGRRTGELQVRLVTSDDGELDLTGFAERSTPTSVLWTRAAGVAETTVGGFTEILDGDGAIHEELGELRFRLSPDAFFQTNTEMAEVLYGIAVDAAGLQGWERVYDLFCGIGTIGLSMAARAGEVWGLEIVESAIADAIANAAANEVPNARFFAGDVRLALRELGEQAGRPDVVVLDPPRAGLSAEDRAPHHRVGPQAHRLRLVQPDDARAERRAARRGRLRAALGAARRHVPADPAHRVRGAARSAVRLSRHDAAATVRLTARPNPPA